MFDFILSLSDKIPAGTRGLDSIKVRVACGLYFNNNVIFDNWFYKSNNYFSVNAHLNTANIATGNNLYMARIEFHTVKVKTFYSVLINRKIWLYQFFISSALRNHLHSSDDSLLFLFKCFRHYSSTPSTNIYTPRPWARIIFEYRDDSYVLWLTLGGTSNDRNMSQSNPNPVPCSWTAFPIFYFLSKIILI